MGTVRESLGGLPRVTASELRKLAVGESRLFVERGNSQRVSSLVVASRIGIEVITKAFALVDVKTYASVKAILVERVK